MPTAAVELLAEPALLLCKVNCGGYVSPITSGTPRVSTHCIFPEGERIGQKSINNTLLIHYRLQIHSLRTVL